MDYYSISLKVFMGRPGTGKIWTVEGDEKLDEKMEEGNLNRSLIWHNFYLHLFLYSTKRITQINLKRFFH